MKRSVTDVKLNVKPVFIGFEHQYYYEGPCRMAGGDAIKPGFDAIVQGKMLKGFLANVQKYVAATGANVLEPAVVCCTDDWDIKDAYFEEMLADEARTDLYVVMSNFGANQVLVEFCCRTSKPVAMNPTKSFGAMSTAPAARRGADILPAFDWPEVARYCRLLRAEKAVRTANILLAPRFDSTTPKAGGNDSFVCLSDAYAKAGMPLPSRERARAHGHDGSAARRRQPHHARTRHAQHNVRRADPLRGYGRRAHGRGRSMHRRQVVRGEVARRMDRRAEAHGRVRLRRIRRPLSGCLLDSPLE